MVYDETTNSLYYAGGAEMVDITSPNFQFVEYQHAWKYSFDDDQWTVIPDIPYLGNHMSFVSAVDDAGDLHHIFVGGQVGRTAVDSNLDDHYELDPATDTWNKLTAMPFARGHTSSSTIPYGCGYLMIGGYTNVDNRCEEISYYDISKDHWFHVGSLPERQTTPVCEINEDWLICETGWTDRPWSFRRRITTE